MQPVPAAPAERSKTSLEEVLAEAVAVRVPPSHGSFGSAVSAQEEPSPLGMLVPLPSEGEKVVDPSGGNPLDHTPRREGLPMGCGDQQPPPLPQLQPNQNPDERLTTLEKLTVDLYRELQGVKNELQNVLSAAKIASEESQKVALRLEMMEKEWLLWTEGQYTEAPEPEQANAEEAGPGRTQPQELRVVALTPGGPPRLPEEAQFEDLLGLELEEDPLLQWWDAAAPQEGQNHNMAPLPLGAPQAIALGAGVPQPGVHGMTSAGVPPGLGLATVTAVGNLAGSRPEGQLQATHQPQNVDGQRGDAYPVSASLSGLVLPGVSTGPPMTSPTVGFDAQQGILQQRDSDIFDFLVGTRPRTPAGQEPTLAGPSGSGSRGLAGPTGPHASALSRGAAPGELSENNLLRAVEMERQPALTGTALPTASVASPSMAELNMVLKTIQSLVPEFPKLEPGDPSTRARRLQQWLLQVSQAIEPAGLHVTSWWQWVRTPAENTHAIYLTKPLDQREHVYPQEVLPPQLTQIESWMRPRILASLPKTQRDWVDLRAQAGVSDKSNTLVYYLYKFFAPGSPTDKDSLLRKVLNPNVCTNAASAQIELMRWRTDVQRLKALGCMPPDIMMSYRALESIFGTVFDKAEPQLHMRWIMLKNRLGLPHIVTPESFKAVSEFADAELSALVLLGGTALNPGLPLTDNQKARQLQLKEAEKKRAARAAGSQETPSAGVQPPMAARLSSPLSPWAQPCTSWQKGVCNRGVSCHFHHPGFPVEEKKCFICKSSAHSSKECTCPGGGADPEKDKHWGEYRTRRTQAEEAGKIGKGKKVERGSPRARRARATREEATPERTQQTQT